MDQKFVVMLSRAPGQEGDLEPAIRRLFADLKGCQVLSVVQKERYLTVTLVALGVAELIGPKELRAFVSILTDRFRDSARLDSVRSIAVGGALDHVNRILTKEKKP